MSLLETLQGRFGICILKLYFCSSIFFQLFFNFDQWRKGNKNKVTDWSNKLRKIKHWRCYNNAVAALPNHIKQLATILERIEQSRKKIAFPGGEAWHCLSLDIEDFFIRIRMIMDDIAKINLAFYPDKIEQMKGLDSFNDQMKWFIEKRCKVDPDYTTYLQGIKDWFLNMKNMRDDVVHRCYEASLYYENSGLGFHIGSPYEVRQNKDDKDFIKNITDYFDETVKKLCQLLLSYDEHFQNRIKKIWPCYNEPARQPIVDTIRELVGIDNDDEFLRHLEELQKRKRFGGNYDNNK